MTAAARIWVDADACPNVIKDILYRAAERTGVNVTLVANQPLTTPRIPRLRSIQVASGFDVADNEIVKRVSPGDLVITDTMRSSGNVGGGPPPLTLANRNAFAQHLDTWLARRLKF